MGFHLCLLGDRLLPYHTPMYILGLLFHKRIRRKSPAGVLCPSSSNCYTMGESFARLSLVFPERNNIYFNWLGVYHVKGKRKLQGDSKAFGLAWYTHKCSSQGHSVCSGRGKVWIFSDSSWDGNHLSLSSWICLFSSSSVFLPWDDLKL